MVKAEPPPSGAKAESAARSMHELLNSLALTSTEKWAALIQATTIWIAHESGTYDEFLRNCDTACKLLTQYAISNRKAYEATIEAKGKPNVD